MYNPQYPMHTKHTPCISCIKLRKCSYNQQDRVLRKLPFSSLSSLHGTTLPHNNWFEFIVLLPLGMQLSIFVHLIAAAILSTLLLHAHILVIFPSSLLDKISNTYPHASFRPRVIRGFLGSKMGLLRKIIK